MHLKRNKFSEKGIPNFQHTFTPFIYFGDKNKSILGFCLDIYDSYILTCVPETNLTVDPFFIKEIR